MSKEWERVLIPAGPAEAAANGHVVADGAAAFDGCEKAEIVRVEIDTVILRQAKGCLEFSRQIYLAVDRFHAVGLLGIRAELFAIEPDVVVGLRARGQV